MSKHPNNLITGLFRRARTDKQQHDSLPLYQENASGGFINLDNNHDIQLQLKVIDLTVEDLNMLRSIRPLIEHHISDIMDIFYKSLLDVEELRAIINEHSTIERLKGTLRQHITEMFNGQIDQAYIAKRLRIAEVHQRIGLVPKWYLVAFQNLQNAIITIIVNQFPDRKMSFKMNKTVTKLLNFEQQIVLEAYERKHIEERELHNEQVKEELKRTIAHVTEGLAALAEQTSASVEELIAISESVNHAIQSTTDESADSHSRVEQGAIQLDHLSDRIHSIQASSQTMSEGTRKLVTTSAQIEKIVTIVDGISSQIKLLSLNAAIEAARAGEHGRGFSVVADEVKKLSTDTMNAVNQISKIIKQSSMHTEQVADAVQHVQEQTELGEREVTETNVVFGQIKRSLDNSLANIAKISEDVGSLVMAIKEIGTATDRVADWTQELNTSTQNL